MELMTERLSNSERGEQFVVIKSWHTVIIVLSLIVTGVFSYATLESATSENSRRIHDIEQRPAPSQESIDNLNWRLKRLELKLDQQDERAFQQSIASEGKKPVQH